MFPSIIPIFRSIFRTSKIRNNNKRMNNRYRFRMEGVVRSSSSRHQKYRNPISILRYLYNSLDDSTRFSGAWKWRLNPGWHSTCSNDFDETLVADPRSTVTPIYRACCARQSAWNAPRLSNNRGFATRRDRVVPVHPIIRRLPLIIYNLQSGLMFRRSIFLSRLTRFVLWINRAGKIYRTRVINLNEMLFYV